MGECRGGVHCAMPRCRDICPQTKKTQSKLNTQPYSVWQVTSYQSSPPVCPGGLSVKIVDNTKTSWKLFQVVRELVYNKLVPNMSQISKFQDIWT